MSKIPVAQLRFTYWGRAEARRMPGVSCGTMQCQILMYSDEENDRGTGFPQKTVAMKNITSPKPAIVRAKRKSVAEIGLDAPLIVVQRPKSLKKFSKNEYPRVL